MTEDTMTLRWDMVDDLEDDYKLDGMTEEEVVKLLGEPGAKSTIEWTYDLGMARRGIDTGTLSLTFENGKVKTHHVRAG
jgi:outer membrane protein assembly factor BamE (lipoprotein component of BamABCDE complex)